MIFVNTCAAELFKGYNKICEAEKTQRTQWEETLLKEYARRQEQYHLVQQKRKQHQARLPVMLIVGLGAVFVICLAAYFFWNPSRAAVLFVAGVIGLAVFWLMPLRLWRSQPPQHPLRSPLKEQLFQPLLPSWRNRLAAPLPTEIVRPGDRGEIMFLEALRDNLSDDYYVLWRVKPLPGDDIDVVVVGPKGVWAFEVKLWAGEITWFNGRWSQKKSHYEAGGIQVEEDVGIGKPPDQQWRRMAEQVKKILQSQARQLVFTTPDLINIQGGLVFTHPTATYHIPRQGLFFEWGDIAHWLQRLQAAPVMADLNERKILQVVDVLLARHQELNKDTLTASSMVVYAEQLISQAEERLTGWIGAAPDKASSTRIQPGKV